MSKKIINVVAAAIEKDGKIFCAQRPEGKSLGGYWEFPGGKLEEGVHCFLGAVGVAMPAGQPWCWIFYLTNSRTSHEKRSLVFFAM